MRLLTAFILSMAIGISAPSFASTPNPQQLALAKQGDMRAQNIVGFQYEVAKDYFKAKEWYQKSANQGFAAAQYHLGKLYFEGKGTRQDYSTGIRWYQKAIAGGNWLAAMELGFFYDKRKNHAKAKEMYGKACDLGHQGGCELYRKRNEQGY